MSGGEERRGELCVSSTRAADIDTTPAVINIS